MNKRQAERGETPEGPLISCLEISGPSDAGQLGSRSGRGEGETFCRFVFKAMILFGEFDL